MAAHVPVRLRIGATLPAGAKVTKVRLDGRRCAAYTTRVTNRGLEVTVRTGAGPARAGRDQSLTAGSRISACSLSGGYP